jgi:hypothetical protein
MSGTKGDQMMLEGGCHCRAVRYRVSGETAHVALCHCIDCRRHAGAPTVCWAAVKGDQLEVEGKLTTYASSEHGRRQFCPGTLDDPEAMPPAVHIQTAERLNYMTRLDDLPAFERYPG